MAREKYSVITCRVAGRKHYGLLVKVAGSDEAGYIDRSDIANAALADEEWPSAGEEVRCVVLGYTGDGRLRLSSKPRDVALSASGINVGEALRHWLAVRDAGQSDRGGMAEYLQMSYAVPVLRWALQDRPSSADYKIAQWALALLSEETRSQVLRP